MRGLPQAAFEVRQFFFAQSDEASDEGLLVASSSNLSKEPLGTAVPDTEDAVSESLQIRQARLAEVDDAGGPNAAPVPPFDRVCDKCLCLIATPIGPVSNAEVRDEAHPVQTPVQFEQEIGLVVVVDDELLDDATQDGRAGWRLEGILNEAHRGRTTLCSEEEKRHLSQNGNGDKVQ